MAKKRATSRQYAAGEVTVAATAIWTLRKHLEESGQVRDLTNFLNACGQVAAGILATAPTKFADEWVEGVRDDVETMREQAKKEQLRRMPVRRTKH